MCAIKSDVPFWILTGSRRVPTLLVAAMLATRLSAAASPLPKYEVGDTARVDILTPVPLIVIDHARTDALRQDEARRDSAIFRFYPQVADEAEAGLLEAFATARQAFLQAVEAAYGRRTLNEAAVAFPRFRRLVESFQRQGQAFPVSADLARLWALGGAHESIVTNLAARLREIMEHPIVVEPLPAERGSGPSQAKMISVRPKELAVDLALVEQEAADVFMTNIYTLGRARQELQAGFPPQERQMSDFLAAFLKDNCAFDEDLTQQCRRKRTEGIWAADEYQAGQLIVKSGDIIDLRLKAVLDQLRARTPGEPQKSEPTKALAKVPLATTKLYEQTASPGVTAQPIVGQDRWLLRGILASTLALPFVLWGLGFRRLSQPLVPARMRKDGHSATLISCPSCTGTIVLPLEVTSSGTSPAPATQAALAEGELLPQEASAQYWKERALAAERHAQRTNQVLRANVLPHFARWLKTKLVRRLAGQRTELLETQKKAEQELASLEQRLAAVQAPLEERLRAYEERIAELETDLTVKGEQNRELIQATIAITKRKLEAERAKETVQWR